jgi:hypothetical protein
MAMRVVYLPRRSSGVVVLALAAYVASCTGVAFLSIGPKRGGTGRGNKVARVPAGRRQSKSRHIIARQESVKQGTIQEELDVLLQESERLKAEVREMRREADDSRAEHLERCWRRVAGGKACHSAAAFERVLREADVDLTPRHAQKLFQLHDATGDGIRLDEFIDFFDRLPEELEEIQTKEQRRHSEESKQRMKQAWQASQRERELEEQARWLESLPGNPSLPLQPTMSIFSVGVYVLPMIDAVIAWGGPLQRGPLELHALQPLLFVAMVFFTAERSLPRQVRFHLNQAVLLDSLLQVVKLTAIWLTMLRVVPLPERVHDLNPLNEFVDVSDLITGVVPLMMKGAVVLCAVCVFLSAVSVFCVAKPPDIPSVSAEATRRSERANSSWLEADLFDMLPSPAWFPMLGILAFSIVSCEYIETTFLILKSAWSSFCGS